MLGPVAFQLDTWFAKDVQNLECATASDGAQENKGHIWQVIAGATAGVRAGRTASSQSLGKLSSGAMVKVLAAEGDMLNYKLLQGEGPTTGWVRSKDLQEKPGWASTDEVKQLCGFVEKKQGYQKKGLTKQRTSAAADTDVKAAALNPQDVLKLYGQRLTSPATGGSLDEVPVAQGKQAEEQQDVLPEAVLAYLKLHMPHLVPANVAVAESQQTPLESQSPAGGSSDDEAVREELERDLVQGKVSKKREAKLRCDIAEDSDGETVRLCCSCHLPVGDVAYKGNEQKGFFQGQKGYFHSECMAEHMQQLMKKEEEARRQQDAVLKQKRREEHAIGWKASSIPSNKGPAQKLSVSPLPEGMTCLVFDAQSNSVRVAPTVEPAAAVNLEYLSIALQVRYRERREPFFSLDPVESGNGDIKGRWQTKKFEPEWLAGTSVGEVLFQADYHLKELSMGECEQPVTGMRSCFEDLVEGELWAAREWFVVRKAELHLTEDQVLMPFVKMGVEAREQVRGRFGLEDAPVTRPDHPLVKYAEAFTQNFELIAERKSSIFYLRELAKASVLAKFLVEAKVDLEDAWFNLAEEPQTVCCMEVPQLWNDRCFSTIEVQNGAIQDAEERRGTTGRALYGGVSFDLNRFRLFSGIAAAPSAVSKEFPAAPKFPFASPPEHSLFGAEPLAGSDDFRGVNLSLDKFNLDKPMKVTIPTGSWGANVKSPGACGAIGDAFWKIIKEDSESMFKKDDKVLLNAVFNPQLSDRRIEGMTFVPPDTSLTHMNKLKELVKQEEVVRDQRKAHFFSSSFVVGDAGNSFPISWTDACELKRAKEAHGTYTLSARPDYKANADMFDDFLASATPTFDRSTEDGVRFRIYKCGSLEVRTCQEPDGNEIIGAVFSVRTASQISAKSEQSRTICETEKVVKAVQYVERGTRGIAKSTSTIALNGRPYQQFYVLLETNLGSRIVTEKLSDGTVMWKENPTDVDDRNSLAKVVFTKDCTSTGLTIKDMQCYKQGACTGKRASASKRKQYASGAFKKAAGITSKA